MNIHDLYRPFLRYFRTKRMRRFRQFFGLTEATRVPDVGGDAFDWSLLPTCPNLTIVNLYTPTGKCDVCWVMADGRYLPFKDGAFDVAYSNSVVEHLGNRDSMRMFAEEHHLRTFGPQKDLAANKPPNMGPRPPSGPICGALSAKCKDSEKKFVVLESGISFKRPTSDSR